MLQFAANTGVIVQNGATLTLEHDVQLKSSGTGGWNGVKLTNGGILKMKEDSKIKDAKIGIEVEDGCQVDLYKATLSNNQYGVYFHPDASSKNSRLELSNFIWDENYLAVYNFPASSSAINLVSEASTDPATKSEWVAYDQHFLAQVYLDQVKDVHFRGCNFLNQT